MQAVQTTVDQQHQVGEQFQPAQAQCQVEQDYPGAHQSQMNLHISGDHRFSADQQQSDGEQFQAAQQDAGAEEHAIQTVVDQQQQAWGEDQAGHLFPDVEQSQDPQEFLEQVPVDDSAQIHAPQQQPSQGYALWTDDPSSQVTFLDQLDELTAMAQGDASQPHPLQDDQQPVEYWHDQPQAAGLLQDFDDQFYFNQALPYDEAQGHAETQGDDE